MKTPKNYSFHVRSTRKELLMEYFLPLLAEFAILFLCILPFRFVKAAGPLIEEPSMVGRELTKPTAGRLGFGILAILLWLVFTHLASKAAEKEKHYTSSFLGFAAGILLWQFIGEISWHYSVGGVHFVPFESVTTFPAAILFILLMIYGKKHHSFDWGVWCMLMSFAFNWMGHYVMEGTYPFAASVFDQHTWYIGASAVSGILGFIYSIIFLLFRVKTRRGRIMASMLTYISIGVLMFGLMEG
ncbi:MAG: hypothetical protein IJM63_04825 [Solobacterium sp.]|nr:hypothetical protein [Solobacterium sp.]